MSRPLTEVLVPRPLFTTAEPQPVLVKEPATDVHTTSSTSGVAEKEAPLVRLRQAMFAGSPDCPEATEDDAIMETGEASDTLREGADEQGVCAVASPAVSAPKSRPQYLPFLCGTFGCTLPDKHSGLHKFAVTEVGRKRAPNVRLNPMKGGGLGGGSAAPEEPKSEPSASSPVVASTAQPQRKKPRLESKPVDKQQEKHIKGGEKSTEEAAEEVETAEEAETRLYWLAATEAEIAKIEEEIEELRTQLPPLRRRLASLKQPSKRRSTAAYMENPYMH